MASIPTIDLSKLNLGDWKLPEFKLPEFDLPKFELPDFDLPDMPTAEQVTSYVRDAAYVGVGLAAMTVERLQALQQQLIDLVKERVPS
jgi:hypothetical protein